MIRKLAFAAFILLLTPFAAHAQYATFSSNPPSGDNSNRIATTSWVQANSGGGSSAQCLTLESYGGGIGVSDNTAALTAAVAALPARGGCISSGPGIYTFTQANTITFPSGTNLWRVGIHGAGKDVTIWQWNANVTNSLTLALSQSGHSFQITDMTFDTSIAGGGVGIVVTGTSGSCETFAPKGFNNVSFRGSDAFEGTAYWNTEVSVSGVSSVYFTGVDWIGVTGTTTVNGAAIHGTGSGCLNYATQFNHNNWYGMNNGVIMGAYTQDLQILGGSFGGNTIVSTNASEVDLLNLMVQGVSINGNSNTIALASAVQQVIVTGNLFYIQPSTSGFYCALCDGGVINDNTFYSAPGTPSSNDGISIVSNPAGQPMSITGNSFYELAAGANFASGAAGINIQSNSYAGNTAKVSNAGTITAGNCTGISGTCTAGATP